MSFIPECDKCGSEDHDDLRPVCDNTEKQEVLNVCDDCYNKTSKKKVKKVEDYDARGMDNRVISYLPCDNCTCIVNQLYSFLKNSHIEYHLVLCKKCHVLLQGDYECTITKCNYTMSKLPSTELRKKYLQMAIKKRDDCREARIRNKKRDEERWALERGECLIVDD